MATIWGVLIRIDGAIYNLICYVYEIFYYLATLNIFTEEHYQGIVSRIYVVLGLFMLFVLAYSLLKAIINPDDYAKSDQSFPKLIKNVVVSLVIIVLLPTVFSVAFNIQNAVLNNNTIPKIILGIDDAAENDVGGGRTIAYNLFKAFFYPESCSSDSIDDCRSDINGNGSWGATNGYPLSDRDEEVLAGGSFSVYSYYSEAVRDDDLSYLFPISTIAGIFTLYVLLNFCFDMAIRVVKLAFYQIIAPIPVICRVLPGGGMKDVFNKWVKQIISIFLEVFIRIGVITICIYLVEILVDAYEEGLPNIDSLDIIQQPIVLALVIMGIVIFMKQAPQILGDLLNLKTDGMKLGLMDKLAMGGGLLAGAAVGGGLTTGIRNAVGGTRSTFRNVKNAKGFRGKVGALAGGALGIATSTVAGAGSGLVRGGYAGKGAKNFKDMAGAAGKGAAGAAAAKAKREAYRASRKVNGPNIPVIGSVLGAIGTAGNVALGHMAGAGRSVAQWAGIGNTDALEADNKIIDDIAAKKKAIRTSVEGVIDGEANKSSSSFKLGKYSAEELRKKMLAIQDARAGNLVDSNGKKVTVAQAQQAYDQYRYDFSQFLQNTVLSKKEFEKLSEDKDTKGIQAKLYASYAQGEALKETLSRNLDKEYVIESGFNKGNVNGDLSVSDGPLKALGDELDIAKAKNDAEIARIQRQKQENNGGGK